MRTAQEIAYAAYDELDVHFVRRYVLRNACNTDKDVIEFCRNQCYEPGASKQLIGHAAAILARLLI